MKKINAISLFTGAGGMDIGFKEAGFNIVLANELMKEAANTYVANNPETEIIVDDVNRHLDDFAKVKNVDLVFGGPPCQGFSVAGKMDPNDERSKLIFSFLDVVRVTQPKMFVMENVKALGVLGKWDDVRKKYLSIAHELGYCCSYFILNASEYGVSQKRERVFFIGSRLVSDENQLKEDVGAILVKLKTKPLTVRNLLIDLGRAGTEKHKNTCTAKITFATTPVMRKSPYSGMYFNGQGRPINVDGYANTLPASMGGNKTPFVDEDYLYGDATEDWVVSYHKGLVDKTIKPVFKEAPSRLRRISIQEAKRIQSFPDNYIFCGNASKIYTQIGNAVPPKLALAVAKCVLKILKKE